MRIGGFGGACGLADWLRVERVRLLVDATHPFASRISANARAAAGQVGIPLLRLSRPAWRTQPGDSWLPARDATAAAALLGARPRRVFLAIGARGLAPFRAAPQHRYVIRCIDPPPPALLPPQAELMLGRGPFALADELALLRGSAIEMLVAKNSGGAAAAAKLAAARLLGLPVVMIERPDEAPAACGAASAAAAMTWLVSHSITERPV